MTSGAKPLPTRTRLSRPAHPATCADIPFTAADLADALAWEARRDAVTALWLDIAAQIEVVVKRRHEERE